MIDREQIIERARASGGADITSNGYTSWVGTQTTEFLERFAELVASDERRANIACIGRIAALVGDPIDQARLFEAIDAIRARGQA